MATPDYNQGNERREATSPGELKRASALKEKGVPKATTQDSCFSHMIRTGQSLRVQPVEVQPARAGQPACPSLASSGGPWADRAHPAWKVSFGKQRRKLKTLRNVCFRECRAAENLFLLYSMPPSC